MLAQDAALQRRAGELSRELRGRVDELVDRELAAPSAELIELVGERPEQRAPALRWENRARPVAAYRAEHEISEPGLGPEPEDPERHRAWQRTGRALQDRARGLEHNS